MSGLSTILMIPGIGGGGGGAPTPVLSWSGPSSGEVGSASTNFTVSITDPPAGDTIITFASSGSGDTLSVATRTLNSGALSATVTLTPGTDGARNVTITNDRSISNPAAVVYTSAYETDYAAILARAVTLGYTQPSAAQRIKQQTLLKAFKTAGIWTKLDAFWMYANDGSKEFATLNWKAPSSYQNTLVNSPTFQSNLGFLGDGVAARIESNFNCSTNGVNYTLNSAGRFVWVYSASNNTNGPEGISGFGGNCILAVSSTGQRINGGASAALSSAVDMGGTGLRAIYRTSSTNVELFVDTTQSSRTQSSTAIQNATQSLLARASFFWAGGASCYGIGGPLVSENTDLRSAINTYLASL
jgi:hypothetical protein